MSLKLLDAIKSRPAVLVMILIITLLGLVLLLPKPNYPEVADRRLLDDPFLGNPDAAIVLIEYGDYACEVCRLWHRAQVREGLLQRYPDQVLFIWRDNARRSTASIKAAEAGQCAHNQGRFWEYHDLLYEQDAGLGSGSIERVCFPAGSGYADFQSMPGRESDAPQGGI